MQCTAGCLLGILFVHLLSGIEKCVGKNCPNNFLLCDPNHWLCAVSDTCCANLFNYAQGNCEMLGYNEMSVTYSIFQILNVPPNLTRTRFLQTQSKKIKMHLNVISVSHGHIWSGSSLIQIKILDHAWLPPVAWAKEPIAGGSKPRPKNSIPIGLDHDQKCTMWRPYDMTQIHKRIIQHHWLPWLYHWLPHVCDHKKNEMCRIYSQRCEKRFNEL